MHDVPQSARIQIGTKINTVLQSPPIEDEDPEAYTYEPLHPECHIQTEEFHEMEHPEHPSFDNNEEPVQQQQSESVKLESPPTQQNFKYHIMDLFWIINKKFSKKEDIHELEAQFVTISFNMDFGNLRVAFFNIPNGAIHGHTVFLSKLQRITSGTIYPSSCIRLTNNPGDDTFTCMEQLINFDATQKWQLERPRVSIQKNESIIRISIYDPSIDKTIFYDFTEDHKFMLEKAANFVINEGFLLHGKNIIQNR